jgi:hypothetical protein
MSKQPATPPRPTRAAPRMATARTTPLVARSKKKEGGPVKPFQLPFEAKNIRIILLGVLVVALGYLLMWMSPTMSDMALTVSPIILVIGYCIIIPMGILAGTSSTRRKETIITESTTNGTL